MINIEHVTILQVSKIKESLIGTVWIYTIRVSKNETDSFEIFRKYSELYDLHQLLLKYYPSSMGYQLPNFPKRVFFETSKVAEERRELLNTYFKSILELNFCRSDSTFKTFLSRHGRDLTRSETILALASASSPTEKTSKSDGKPKIEIGAPVMHQEYILLEDWQPDGDRDNVLVPMKKGEKVFVIEKTASGWWLAAPAGRMESIIPGYVEASYLDTEENKVTPESVKCEEKFIVIENYAAMNDDELTVIKGESVTVTMKFCDGWFECSRGNNRGKVPATVVRPDLTGADDDLSIKRAIPKRRQSISKRK